MENGVSEQTANHIQTLLNKDEPFNVAINRLKGFAKAETEVGSERTVGKNRKRSRL